MLALLHHPEKTLLNRVFVIGLFCGTSKPNPVNEYHQPSVEELEPALCDAFDFQGAHYRIQLRPVLCEAAAKAFVECTEGHGSYYRHDKCYAAGAYCESITFPCLHAPLCTDELFNAQLQEERHREISPLTAIGVLMVTRCPIDYMDCVCLGVVRKLVILGLIRGPLSVRLDCESVEIRSFKLSSLGKLSITDFQR